MNFVRSQRKSNARAQRLAEFRLDLEFAEFERACLSGRETASNGNECREHRLRALRPVGGRGVSLDSSCHHCSVPWSIGRHSGYECRSFRSTRRFYVLCSKIQ